MRGTEGPDVREVVVERVLEHLHRTVGDKIAVLMDRQGLTEAEAIEVVARLRGLLGSWSPQTTDAAERRHPRER